MEAVSALSRVDAPAELAADLAAFHHASYGWALECCRRDRQEAEEVLQACYVKALDGRARFGGNSALRTWFFGVIRYTAAERRRRDGFRRLALMNWFAGRPAPKPAASPEHLSGQGELRTRLNRLIVGLSDRQREVLHMVFYQELTLDETAQVLGLSIGSVRRHYERGKARLRLALANTGETK